MAGEDPRGMIEQAFARYCEPEQRARFLDAYARDVTLHGFPEGIEGFDGLRRFHEALWKGFPNARIELEDVLVDADRAVARYRLTGRHDGDYLGVGPTGRTVDVDGMTILRFSGDGLVSEEWHAPVELSILRQLGAVRLRMPSEPTKAIRLPPRMSASAAAAALRWEEEHADD